MKSAAIYLAISSNLLMLASCSHQHYAFVQPSTPSHYYSVPDVGTQPDAIVKTDSAGPSELMASVTNDLPQPTATPAYALVAAGDETPVTDHVQVATSSPTSVYAELSPRKVQQQLRAYARERKAHRPADGSGGTNGLAIAALICGIVGLLVLPILFGPLAVIFGAIGMSQTKQRGERGYGAAVAGFVMGIIATVILLIALAR